MAPANPFARSRIFLGARNVSIAHLFAFDLPVGSCLWWQNFDGSTSTVSSSSSQAPVKLEVVSIYTKALPGMGSTMPWIAEKVAAVSGNQIQMHVKEPGESIPGREIMEAVSTGKIDGGYGASGFWTGKIPAAPLLFTAIPFGPEAPEYLAWLYHGNGMALYQEMYDQAGFNIKVLVAGISAPETSGWFKREINTRADLKA